MTPNDTQLQDLLVKGVVLIGQGDVKAGLSAVYPNGFQMLV